MAAKPTLLLSDVVVSLGASVSSFTEKTALKKLIDANGGRVSYMINSEVRTVLFSLTSWRDTHVCQNQTTHFISDEEEVQAKSLKVRTAIRYGCFIISKDWLVKSCESGKRQFELR